MCVGALKSNKLQLVRLREGLLGEDWPEGPEREGDLLRATQLLRQS